MVGHESEWGTSAARDGEPQYRILSARGTSELSWRLTEKDLASSSGRSIPFVSIRAIRLYDAPGARTLSGQLLAVAGGRCVVRSSSGPTVTLASTQLREKGRTEDCSATYDPFVAELLARIKAVNSQVVVRTGMPDLTLALWWLAFLVAIAGTLFAAAVTALAVVSHPTDWNGLLTGVIVLGGAGLSMLATGRVLLRGRPRPVRQDVSG